MRALSMSFGVLHRDHSISSPGYPPRDGTPTHSFSWACPRCGKRLPSFQPITLLWWIPLRAASCLAFAAGRY
jgi:hypothetical protein